MAVKFAVGVPVQRMCDAEEMMVSKVSTSCGERAPWT
jgi:hypothetical protein